MDIRHEHIERYQHPSIEKLRKAAVEVMENYSPKYINNLKIEINLDRSKKDVNINMLIFNQWHRPPAKPICV